MTETSTGINLWYCDHDAIWGEWIEDLLEVAGVAVSPPGEVLAGRRTVAIISESSADPPPGVGPLILDVSVVSGLAADRAAAAVLELVGVPVPDGRLETGARYPGQPPAILKAPPRNARFTGRDETLRELRALFRSPGTDVVEPVVLLGIGGVGKRQVALEYVYRYAGAYDIVWWVRADPPQFVDSSLSDLALQLGLAAGATATENARLLVRALSQGNPTDRWLLVLDSAEEYAAIVDLIPAGQGHTLITSRDPAWSDRAQSVRVDVFNRSESVAHLLKRNPGLADEQADRIAAVLGDLPIAISAAAAWLAETGASGDEFLGDVAGERSRELPGVRSADRPDGTAITAIWDLSLQRLAEESPSAYRLLQLCSVTASDISLELLASDAFAAAITDGVSGITGRDVRLALVEALNRLALIKVDERAGMVHVHRLLQEAVRHRFSPDELADARHRVHTVLAAARPTGEVDDPQTWPRFRTLWPHLLMSDAASCDDDDVRRLLIDRLRYLWVRGDLEQAENFGARVAADWGDELHMAPSPDLLRHHLHLRFNLANVVRSRGRFADARDIDEAVLAAQREHLGDQHEHTLRTAGSLAADMRGLGRYADALDLAREVHASWLDVFGEDNLRTLAAANNLATSHRLCGDYAAALDRDRDVHRRRRVLLGEDHPYTLHSASCVGRDLRELGEYAAAAALLRDVYADIVQARGADQVEAHLARANLAASLRTIGAADEAMVLLDEAYAFLRANFGAVSPETQACRLSRATNLLTVGDYEAAEREMRAVMQGYADSLGDAHPHTLICLSNLSAIRRSREDLGEALACARTAGDALDEILGPGHPSTVAARMNHAAALAGLGDQVTARQRMAQAAERLAEILGASHPDTMRCRINLALIDRALGDPVPQLPILLADLELLIGTGHPSMRTFGMGELVHRIVDPHPF